MPFMRRALALAAALALLAPATAAACSHDDTAWFETFVDTSCLVAPLSSTTLDALGGLRLVTNGAPLTTSWDTDAHFDTGLSWESTPFTPIGVRTLATSGSGTAATLTLPATRLPLDRGAGGSVLDPAASSAGDGDGVSDPTVVKVGSTYRMWYSGMAEHGAAPRIFEATSTNGTTWTRANGGLPVLQGTPGAFDANGVSAPHVVHDPADAAAPYRMWYAGQGKVYGAIGLATSPDGITWTKRDDAATPALADPVLTHGQAGSADSFSAGDPSVLKDGATWKLWYTGDDSSKKRIAYATSPDGVTWTKGGKVIAPEDPGANANYSFGAFAPSVFKTGPASYRMLLTGRKLVSGSTFQTKIMDAGSSDGISWSAPSPAVNPAGNSSKFDYSNLDAPHVLADPGAGSSSYKLFYAGNTIDANGNFHTRIGLATGADGNSFGKVNGAQTGDSVFDVGAAGKRVRRAQRLRPRRRRGGRRGAGTDRLLRRRARQRLQAPPRPGDLARRRRLGQAGRRAGGRLAVRARQRVRRGWPARPERPPRRELGCRQRRLVPVLHCARRRQQLDRARRHRPGRGDGAARHELLVGAHPGARAGRRGLRLRRRRPPVDRQGRRRRLHPLLRRHRRRRRQLDRARQRRRGRRALQRPHATAHARRGRQLRRRRRQGPGRRQGRRGRLPDALHRCRGEQRRRAHRADRPGDLRRRHHVDQAGRRAVAQRRAVQRRRVGRARGGHARRRRDAARVGDRRRSRRPRPCAASHERLPHAALAGCGRSERRCDLPARRPRDARCATSVRSRARRRAAASSCG